MIDVTDKLRQAMKDLKAQAEQTEDPEERASIMYQVSCIASTLLQLENPGKPREHGYDGVYSGWIGQGNPIPGKTARRVK